MEQDYGPYKVHPFLAEIPVMTDTEFAGLVESIGRLGLVRPILLTYDQSTIIDGRMRYLACMKAGIWPVYTVLAEDYTELELLDLIYAENVIRKHRTVADREGDYDRIVEYFRDQNRAK